jgi:beta-glucosidase
MKRELLLAALATALWNSVSSLAAQAPPVVAPPPVQAQTRESPLFSARASQFADSVLKLMTLDEKIGQLNQSPGEGSQTGPRVPAGGEALIRAGRVGSFLGIWGADYTRGLQRIATQESRLKIPLLFAMDVIHGFRTIYPVPLAEAASFDPARVEFSARQAYHRGRGRRSVSG